MEKVVLSAPGKLNLILRVLTGPVDGYHHIETLYQSVDLKDMVEVSRGGNGIELASTGLPVPEGPANIAHRAAVAFLDAAGLGEPVRIKLEKKIPPGSGLGGGSADAAAVLAGLNILFEERLGRPEIVEIAGALGADVPFATRGGTALAWSRGDRLIALSPLPAWPVLICVPDFAIDTAWAYREIDRENRVGATAFLYEPADFYSLETLRGLARNDFEDLIMRAHPELREVKDTLMQLGGRIVQLTGTGSAVFALFASERERAGCLKIMRKRFEYRFVSTRLSPEGVQVEEIE
jgi:4-diphosphocytidyl-2-C-methyl-D-erythritol kinase